MVPINGVGTDHIELVVKLHTLLDYTGPAMYTDGRCTVFGSHPALAAFGHTDP